LIRRRAIQHQLQFTARFAARYQVDHHGRKQLRRC
jgi:hypothetical protein